MSTFSAGDLIARLRRWSDAGALRALDLALTQFVRQQVPEDDPAVLLAVALVSERNGHGHVCLDLRAALERPDALLTRLRDGALATPAVRSELGELLGAVDLNDWTRRLARSPAVAASPEDAAAAGRSAPLSGSEARLTSSGEVAPLLLGGSVERPLLYLRRYWHYEQEIRHGVRMRLRRVPDLPERELGDLLGLAFADAPDADRWQRIACALAARSAFAIITGGPGTGKTTTVVRLLAVLQGLALGRGEPPLRIRLAAPTGKAAARLNESIAARVASLPFERLPQSEVMRGAIPTEVVTLHRLLGPIPGSRHFRHHAGSPLSADVVVVDEASMVDVEMMANLLRALRPDARLILLGDRDQLASVEAGAVLGDFCQRARAAHYTPDTCVWLQRVTGESIDAEHIDPEGSPLDQCIAMLRTSYRFNPEGGIGALAELVNEGVVDRQAVMDRLGAALQLFGRRRKRGADALGRIDAVQLRGEQDTALDGLLRDGYLGYLRVLERGFPGERAEQAALDAWASEVLRAYADFQLLTALREGPWGVDGLNQRALAVLAPALSRLDPRGARQGAAEAPLDARHWFPGRPVLVTRNDYALRLMNGDIGMTLAVPARRADGSSALVLRVAFPVGDGSGGIRWALPSRLQAVETVFAMTVHKSQGSEFAHTALVLPEASSSVLTRELLYTGITRSKRRFTLIYSQDAVLQSALDGRVQRMSGLTGWDGR